MMLDYIAGRAAAEIASDGRVGFFLVWLIATHGETACVTHMAKTFELVSLPPIETLADFIPAFADKYHTDPASISTILGREFDYEVESKIYANTEWSGEMVTFLKNPPFDIGTDEIQQAFNMMMTSSIVAGDLASVEMFFTLIKDLDYTATLTRTVISDNYHTAKLMLHAGAEPKVEIENLALSQGNKLIAQLINSYRKE